MTSPEMTGAPHSAERLLEELAGRIVRRGLSTPAVFFLELHRPLAFLAGQASHVLQPFLAPVFGLESYQRYVRLLNDPNQIERLLQCIERLERDGVQPPEEDP